MQLTLLIAMTLLATVVLADGENSGSAFTAEELKKKYEAIQRERDELRQKPGKITTQIKYLHHHQSNPLLKDKVQNVSNSYIECVQGELNSDAAYDFPMPVGWLYSSFSDGGETTKKFFDTEASEYWVFPNFSCNFKNVLAAVSWMRSGKKAGFRENKGMHDKFRQHKPPFYSGEKYFDHKRSGGVYCDWDGWLYPSSNIGYKYFIDTNRNNELFTLMNVYCHRHSYVRMFYSAQASNDQQQENNAKPFRDISPPSLVGDSDYPDVLCNWDGWLYGDMSGKNWDDSKGNKRYGYEKYFSIDTHPIGDAKKDWVRGRVANPFCSKSGGRYGIVTAVRAFCFFPIRVHRDDKSIQRLRKQECSDL